MELAATIGSQTDIIFGTIGRKGSKRNRHHETHEAHEKKRKEKHRNPRLSFVWFVCFVVSSDLVRDGLADCLRRGRAALIDGELLAFGEHLCDGALDDLGAAHEVGIALGPAKPA